VPTLPTAKYKKGESIKTFGEISEYGALISKWYDTSYTSRNLTPQSTNNTLDSNRSG